MESQIITQLDIPVIHSLELCMSKIVIYGSWLPDTVLVSKILTRQ